VPERRPGREKASVAPVGVDRRREFRRRLLGSLAAHGLLLGALVWAPAPSARPLPSVVTVELVAAPRPAPAARPKPAPAPAARPAPAPPPKPKPKVKVLPKQPSPVPDKPVKVKPRERPPELDYQDALEKLREELGEEAPQAEAPAEEAPEEGAAPPSAGAGRIDPEMAAWQRAVQRHVQSTYVMPPEFRGRGLVAEVCVLAGAAGDVIGTPTVDTSSGDPFFDDNAIRATQRATPLPPPPRGAQELCFQFRGDDR
jgi:TonB family protein